MSVRALIACALLLPSVAHAGFWDDGFWDDGFWDDGFWDADAPTVEVPNVVGQANSTAADMILEGDGLDLGDVTERCSVEADDEVIAQVPVAGVFVALGSLVDVFVSNGVECEDSGGLDGFLNRMGMKIGIGL